MADVWKVKDMWGRSHLYENEKSFTRRMKSSLAEYEERLQWQAKNPGASTLWGPKQPEGFKIENDVWVTVTLDKAELDLYLKRRHDRNQRLYFTKRR